YFNIHDLVGTDMPVLLIATQISPVIGLAMAVILLAMIFNTAVPSLYTFTTVFHRRYSAFQSGCRCGWHCGIFSRVYWFHRSGQYDLPVAWLCRVRDFCRYGSQSVPDQTRRIQKRCKGLSLKQPTYGCEKA